MKFLRFRPFRGSSLPNVAKYLQVDLAKALTDLVEGLRHLTFGDNFESFEWTVENLAAGDSATIPNRLKTPNIEWWTVRCIGAGYLVEPEGGSITDEIIILENAGASAITAKIRFVR